jgi:hypothetical protein
VKKNSSFAEPEASQPAAKPMTVDLPFNRVRNKNRRNEI